MTGDGIGMFFNAAAGAAKEYPGFAGEPIGATGTLFIKAEGIDALHDRLKPRAKIVMPIETRCYGMRESAIEDSDGTLLGGQCHETPQCRVGERR